MSERDSTLCIKDIHESLSRVIEYTQAMDRNKFFADRKTYDAVMWNLEIVAGAVKSVPDEIREKHQDIAWNRVADFGGEVISKYYSIDDEVAWNVIEEKVPELKTQIESGFSDLL